MSHERNLFFGYIHNRLGHHTSLVYNKKELKEEILEIEQLLDALPGIGEARLAVRVTKFYQTERPEVKEVLDELMSSEGIKNYYRFLIRLGGDDIHAKNI